jgi:metalloendopeptidase OMA1, mitochondrial
MHSCSAMLLSVVLLLPAACTQAPVTGRQQFILVSEDQMDQAGAQAYRQVIRKEGVARDQELQRRVETVGARIARVSGIIANAKWEFTVIDDQTPNAFALPGGKVAVNVGLFKVVQNDDQLAAVLGHEIAHVAARHAAERVSQQMIEQGGLQVLGAATQSQAIVQLATAAATVGITLPYSRTQEAEADEIGLMYMARAGFDPRQAIALWQNMERAAGEGPIEFLSTHPSPGSRIERLQALMPKALAEYRAAGGGAGR